MLLTRSPLSPGPKSWFSLDLHVLSAPPAFVLSQDQTLREENMRPYTPAETGRAGQFFSFELELNSSSHSREASAPEALRECAGHARNVLRAVRGEAAA